jgi:ADP-heptose:LPS heptosyltransferase
MIDQPPASPLCGKYLVRNRIANRSLRVTDWLLEKWIWLSAGWHALRYSEGRAGISPLPCTRGRGAGVRGLMRPGLHPLTPDPSSPEYRGRGELTPRPSEYFRACHPIIPQPRRILLANGAHLGDVFLSLSLLPALRGAFPHARIGFLCGTWARCLFENQLQLDWLHHVDHWKLNRSDRPLRKKLHHYLRTRHQALREIRRKRYDVALDLYYYFPNSIPLLWQAGIPCRIGYTSGGFGPLLTHRLDWKPADRHVTDYQADQLRVLGVPEEILRSTPATWSTADEQSTRAVTDNLRNIGVPPHGYVVFHMGTAVAIKEWPLAHWRELAQRLTVEGQALVFTGTAGREERTSEGVRAGLARSVNLCGRLSWNELVMVIRCARLLVGVDSVAGHLGAATGTPCVLISSGITNSAHWRPRGSACRVLSHPVPCAPCYRSGGCEGMECVRQVSVQSAHEAVLEMLRPSARQSA